MFSSNNRISSLINSQVPFFVRNDHRNFVRFLEAYYEWLEQQDQANTIPHNVITKIKNIQSFQDIDATIDMFEKELYKTYLKLIPDETIADKRLILKHVKDFYRARGSEKSVRFLIRILFNQDTEFYYPKVDILKASDGKWFIEKSIKFNDVYIANTVISDVSEVYRMVGKKITGKRSNATAFVERIDTYYEGDTFIREFKISNQVKDFISGEQVYTTFIDDDDIEKEIVANTFSGIVNSITLTKPGAGYSAGDVVAVESNTGSGAIVVIDEVTTGNIKSIFVYNGGAGFQSNSELLISDTTGTGAIANISNVDISGVYHSNTYNVWISIIGGEETTLLDYDINYNSLNPNSNANTTLENAFSYFVYANCGPIIDTKVINSGKNYTAPLISAAANTRIKQLGILGRMKILDGGTGYANNDTILFENPRGCYGVGAKGNVVSVNATGTIEKVGFVQTPGYYPGGAGYIDDLTQIPKFPKANVQSTGGSGANVIVTHLIAQGEDLFSISESAGSILRLTLLAGGGGYETTPTINLKSLGDGTAQAVASIVTGAYSYPGRWLNDDGHVSSYNFLQNRDYYQNFSYVLKVKRSIQKYRKYIKDLIHPAGLKLFGEFPTVDESEEQLQFRGIANTTETKGLIRAKFTTQGNANGTLITITSSKNPTAQTNTYIEFIDSTNGLTYHLSNGKYKIAVKNTTSFNVFQSSVNDRRYVDKLQITGNTKSINIGDVIISQNAGTYGIIQYSYPPYGNVSNLTVNTGYGLTVSRINLSDQAITSNVVIGINDKINVNNKTVMVIGVDHQTVKTSNLILRTGEGSYVNVANLFVTRTSNLTIRTGEGASVTLANVYSRSTSNLKISTGTGAAVNLVNLSAQAGNSNVAFTNGDYIIVNGITSYIVNVWSNSTIVYVTPGITGSITSGNLQLYQTVWSSNSNVSISNGESVLINGVTANVINVRSNSSTIYLSQGVSGNLSNSSWQTYKPARTANSNVAIGINYALNVNNQTVIVTGISNSTINVYPSLSGNLLSNTFVVLKPESIIVSPGLSGNLVSNTLTVIKAEKDYYKTNTVYFNTESVNVYSVGTNDSLTYKTSANIINVVYSGGVNTSGNLYVYLGVII